MAKRAVKGRLLLPCDYSTAQKALLVVAGPREQLDRKGIEKAREWLETSISGTEVRGGDYPLPKSNYVGCVILMAGIGSAPKVKNLLQRAKAVQKKIGGEEPVKEKDLDYLLGDIENL